jgi:hypothetical protein
VAAGDRCVDDLVRRQPGANVVEVVGGSRCCRRSGTASGGDGADTRNDRSASIRDSVHDAVDALITIALVVW